MESHHRVGSAGTRRKYAAFYATNSIPGRWSTTRPRCDSKHVVEAILQRIGFGRRTLLNRLLIRVYLTVLKSFSRAGQTGLPMSQCSRNSAMSASITGSFATQSYNIGRTAQPLEPMLPGLVPLDAAFQQTHEETHVKAKEIVTSRIAKLAAQVEAFADFLVLEKRITVLIQPSVPALCGYRNYWSFRPDVCDGPVRNIVSASGIWY